MVELGSEDLLVLLLASSTIFKEVRRPLSQGLLPGMDLARVDFKPAGQLCNGVLPLEVRGSVVAKEHATTADAIDEITIYVSNAAGGEAVDLTPGNTLVTYTDVSQSVTLDSTSTTGGFTVTPLGSADTDKLVEVGEMYELKVIGLGAKLNPDLSKDTEFTLEIKPPQGAVVHINRRTPIVVETYSDLG